MRVITLVFWGLMATLHLSAGDREVRQTMSQATRFMMEEVSCQGGFVWNYLPDFSRQWGELEAKRTMVWLQSPGTPDVGQVLLDAFHATGDEYYYDYALTVAKCIIHGQLPCGGWNYMFDLEPEDSLKAWYATIGKQAWRLEEFQHYYGNATFDDDASRLCAEFLLRVFLEKRNPEVGAALDKAIGFFLKSQYEHGGWPQRYPLMDNHPFKGKADYSSFVTINDNVMCGNIDFLLQCYTSLGIDSLQQPILKAMHLLRDLQQPAPLAGWADQYTPGDLKPAHARSYEPRSVNTGTTVNMIRKMMEFYRMTGDKSFLEGIPMAIDFLESQRLPDSLALKVRKTPLQKGEMLVPRFICPEDGRPMYVHRRGGNVVNGTYYTDDNTEGTIVHYSSFHVVNVDLLREAFEQTKNLVQKDLQRNSPLRASARRGPERFHYDVNRWNRPGMTLPSAEEVSSAFENGYYWPSPIRQISHPFKPLPQKMDTESMDTQYAQTMAGDEYDTSPYENHTVMGISTQMYIRNMVILINSLIPRQLTASGLDPQRFEGMVEGKPTSLYVLKNKNMEACITNYGARLVSLMVPDKQGVLGDVVLGFDNIDDYHMQKNNFGSVVGRYIGRIKGARFSLDGESFSLQETGGGNISHGGYPGFADKVWDVKEVNDTTLTLSYLSPDKENGFPGNLQTIVTYTLNHLGQLSVDYEAVTDKPTVLNLSNHTFFNLSANPAHDVLNQQLYVNSKRIATFDKNKNLNGEFMKVRNTPFDFSVMKPIGQDIDIMDEQMSITNGYDHSFALRNDGKLSKPAAILFDPESGRTMMVYTTQPAIHVYTANGLKGRQVGKKGIAYPSRSAVCLETMHFADSPNQKNFPSTVLRPGETFRSTTIFQFSTPERNKRHLLGSILTYAGGASLTGLGIIGVVSLLK